jgi:hypothetical protein
MPDPANVCREVATFASPDSGVSIAFTTNQAGMQAWSGTADVFNGSDARKALHGGKSVRDQGDGYSNEVSGSAFAMEFHGGKSRLQVYADHDSL